MRRACFRLKHVSTGKQIKDRNKPKKLTRFSSLPGGCPSGLSVRTWLLCEINLSAHHKGRSFQCASWQHPASAATCHPNETAGVARCASDRIARRGLCRQTEVPTFSSWSFFYDREKTSPCSPNGRALVVRADECVILFSSVDLAVAASAETRDGFCMYRIIVS